ncbi:MAG: hypothetical protein N2039_12810 [Gemmataceae bacterium]|nr:hypothetical protein [Gemmataceae bacterium]
MRKSARIEEQQKAEALQRAIDIANKEQVENRFQKLVSLLVGNQELTTDELEKVAGQNEELVKILREMLNILLTDNELLLKQEQIRKLTELIKQVDAIIKAEKIEQTKMDGNRVPSDVIAKTQQGITKATESVARSLSGKKAEAARPIEGEAKKGDPRAGENKEDTRQAKGTAKEPMRDGESKSGEPKPGDAKSDEPKSGESKSGDAKSGDAKSGESKSESSPKSESSSPQQPPMAEPKNRPDNKADSKGSAGENQSGSPSHSKPSGSQSKPSPGQSPSGESKPSEPSPSPNSPPSPPMGEDPQNVKAQKQIQDAIESQKKIEEELKKNQRESASRHTDDAIAKLEELKKELERRLRQLREEELERLLANLQARCERMLAMQIEVQAGTRRVHSVIQTLPDKRATRIEEQQSQQLSSREAEIVREANRTLQLMTAEGSAVAFALSLEMVRDDMKVIEQRLDRYDVGEFTQQIEQDVIDALKEMIEALKKKRQELQQNRNNPSRPNNNPPPPQRLLDLLAELRLIRSQQLQINKRTIDYARHYQGEQADDPVIQKELEAIAKRQVKIEEMLKKIATGKNR